MFDHPMARSISFLAPALIVLTTATLPAMAAADGELDAIKDSPVMSSLPTGLVCATISWDPPSYTLGCPTGFLDHQPDPDFRPSSPLLA
jgi:hypothetical protein